MPVAPSVLRWACKRSGKSTEDLTARFDKLPEWLSGVQQPTFRQVEDFARAVYVPVGYLFLSRPPEEALPIPDFRTRAGLPVRHPSANLLATIYACQARQDWYRQHARIHGLPELKFVGSKTSDASAEIVAAEMREELGIDLADRRSCSTWTDAVRMFIRQADEAGVLVMVNGVVKSNNYRRLDPDEFRGFALADSLVPLVFINGADTKAAQMFTLAHELAHLWLGASALSDLTAKPGLNSRREEVWCNAVAAEMLVPLEALEPERRPGESLSDALNRLARVFKVSTLVILRRLLDAKWIDRDCFDSVWGEEVQRLDALTRRGSGDGNFYRTTLTRVSHRFARALLSSTLEGSTLYRDAFRMLGLKKTETFHNLARELGIVSSGWG